MIVEYKTLRTGEYESRVVVFRDKHHNIVDMHYHDFSGKLYYPRFVLYHISCDEYAGYVRPRMSPTSITSYNRF